MAEKFRLGTEIIGQTPEGRNIYRNPDGSFSSELRMTFQSPFQSNRIISIPTIFGGKMVSPKRALEIIKKSGGVDPDTGLPVPVFENEEQARRWQEIRTQELNEVLKGLGVDGR